MVKIVDGLEKNLVSIGGPVDEARPSLCVYGEDLDPDEITQLLGTSPSRSHRKGDPLGTGVPRARTGAWILEFPSPASTELEDRIRAILAQLPNDVAVWQQVSDRYTIRMSCVLNLRQWSRGFGLSAGTLRDLGDRRIELDFSIYFVGDDVSNREHG